jgi:hypothetical protein
MNQERDEILEQFIKEYPEVLRMMEHYPKQAKYLWEMYKYDKKLNK